MKTNIIKFNLIISKALILLLTFFSLYACGNNSVDTSKYPQLMDIYNAVVTAYGDDYRPNSPIEKESLTTITGIKTDDIDEFIAEMPMISESLDTFIAIKAIKGKGTDIETELFKYQVFVANESFQYPLNQVKAKASKVIRQGDYVFFIMLGASNPAENPTEAEALTFAEEQTKIGTDVINAMFK